jgi:MYXO-CTERM domain-containing protein
MKRVVLSLSLLLGVSTSVGAGVYAESTDTAGAASAAGGTAAQAHMLNTSSSSLYGTMPITAGTTTNNGAPWIPGTNSTTYTKDAANLNPTALYGADGNLVTGAYNTQGTDNVRDNFAGTNYSGDYWDRVRNYGTDGVRSDGMRVRSTDGVRGYGATNTTTNRTGWGWLGLLGLVGLAGLFRRSSAD